MKHSRYRPTKTKARCNKRYGKNLICKRLPNHPGNHAIRMSPFELNKILNGYTYNEGISNG